MRSFRSAAIALAAIALTAAAVQAAGLFPGFPIVGGASYCSSFSGTGSGSVTAGNFTSAATCNVTVPAGPTVVTGNELIPADTQLGSGQSPQTVLLSMAAINALPYQVASPLSGGSVTVAATTGKLILVPAGTLSPVTVVLPAATSLVDGQTLEFSSTQSLTTVTFTPGANTTMTNTPTALTISTTGAYGYKFLYRTPAANGTTFGVWHRLQ